MRTAYRSLSNWMMTPSCLPRMERFRIWIPNLERRRMTFWNCILMAGSLRNGNESLSLLHWHLERLTVYRSDHCQRLKPSCTKVRWQMPLKDFVWPSVRSPFVSGRMCAARIARGQQIGGWDNVHRLDVQPRKCRSTYRHARSALQRLDFDLEYLVTLLDITDDNLTVAGDLTDEGRFSQRSDTLPWFWW